MRFESPLDDIFLNRSHARVLRALYRMLLAKKNAVEYELRQANAGEASEVVERADRFVGPVRR